jgi:MFS family permease
VFAFASIGGPLVGGFLTDTLSWRWIFYINVPVGILALVITSAVLRLPRPTRAKAPIDYAGVGLTVMAVTPLLLVTVWGGVTFAWSSPVIICLLALSVAMTGVVVWWERRAPEPIFPPHVFAKGVVRAALGTTFFVTATMFAAIIYIPVYLQLVDGESAERSGVLLLPLMAGMLTTSIGSGRLVTRFGRYKAFPVMGTALMAIGMWLLSRLGAHTSLGVASVYMVVFGVGMGMTLQIVVVAVQNAVERRDIGSATSSVSFFRNIGAACGSALLGTILVGRLGYWLPRLVPRGTSLSLSKAFTITPTQFRALPGPARAGVSEAFVHSLHVVFTVGIPIAGLAFVCALLLKEVPLAGALQPPVSVPAARPAPLVGAAAVTATATSDLAVGAGHTEDGSES